MDEANKEDLIEMIEKLTMKQAKAVLWLPAHMGDVTVICDPHTTQKDCLILADRLQREEQYGLALPGSERSYWADRNPPHKCSSKFDPPIKTPGACLGPWFIVRLQTACRTRRRRSSR